MNCELNFKERARKNRRVEGNTEGEASESPQIVGVASI